MILILHEKNENIVLYPGDTYNLVYNHAKSNTKKILLSEEFNRKVVIDKIITFIFIEPNGIPYSGVYGGFLEQGKEWPDELKYSLRLKDLSREQGENLIKYAPISVEFTYD